MTFPPFAKCPRTLAFLEGEFFINLIEAPNRNFDGFDHRRPPAPAIQHDITAANLRARGTAFGKVAQGATSGRFGSSQYQGQQRIRHLGRVTKREGRGIRVRVSHEADYPFG